MADRYVGMLENRAKEKPSYRRNKNENLPAV